LIASTSISAARSPAPDAVGPEREATGPGQPGQVKTGRLLKDPGYITVKTRADFPLQDGIPQAHLEGGTVRVDIAEPKAEERIGKLESEKHEAED